jgi:hypothetical protein
MLLRSGPRLPAAFMRALLAPTILTALVALAPMQLACGEDSGNGGPSKTEVRRVQIDSLAAFACMPKSQRRELRSLEKRHAARLTALARENPPGPGFERIAEADPARQRILRKARAIYREYLPGGRRYDASCFFREREKARRRVENE